MVQGYFIKLESPSFEEVMEFLVSQSQLSQFELVANQPANLYWWVKLYFSSMR